MGGYFGMDPNEHVTPTNTSVLWKCPALLWAISCASLLIGCQRVNNHFIVSSPSGEVSSAELQLCQKNQPLIQSGTSFKGQMAIDCEGSGKIMVQLKDGSVANCHIGYVTPGMEQKFEFVLKDGACG